MTSSSDFVRLSTPELRTGDLTRFGADAVLGDTVTELALSSLVDEARRAARSQGYAVGWAEGRREAAAEGSLRTRAREAEAEAERARWADRQQDALHALSAAAQALVAATAEAQSAVHTQAVALARELTEAIVGHELRHTPDPAADVLARALAAAPSDSPAVLRLHPTVAVHVAGTTPPDVRLLPDPTLGVSDAVVEIDDRVIDLRISAALERVRSVLA